jgi:hypothetical protein
MSPMARTSKRARKSSPLNLPGAFELFTPSKELVLKNIWIFGPLYAIPLIFGIHDWIWTPANGNGSHTYSLNWPGGPLPTYDSSIFIGFSVFWLLFVVITGTIASIMSQAAQLDAVEGKRLDFQILWRTVKEAGLRLFGLYIVMGVVIIVGLFLLIVPGLIFIRRYFLAPYAMLDKKVGIRESMEASAALTKLNTGSVWGVVGVMVLISLIAIVPIIGGLVAFAVGCLYSVAPAIRYHQLKKLA